MTSGLNLSEPRPATSIQKCRAAIMALSAICIILLASGPRHAAASSPGTLRALTYTVQRGDSLWSIARRFDSHVSELKTLNDLKIDLIQPGDILFVPRMVYTVKPGDCLYSIASTYDTTVAQLRIDNSLTTDILQIGQELLLPSSVRPRMSALSGDGTVRIALSPEERDLLVRLVHAEACGEDYIGKVAVAASVLNRVDSPDYPNTVTEVINQVVGKVGYQYTPVANGKINEPGDPEDERAVDAALAGWDPTLGATGFYNPKATSDKWVRTRKVVSVIGNHVFFI